MIARLLIAILCLATCSAYAQTAGQTSFPKKNVGAGATLENVTWSNSTLIYRNSGGTLATAGLAASITIDSGNLVIAPGSVASSHLGSDLALPGNPTTTTQSAGNSSTRIATTAFVGGEIASYAAKRYRTPTAKASGTPFTFALGDDIKLLYITGSDPTTVTVPHSDDVAFTGGAEILVWCGNAVVTFAGDTGVGVTAPTSGLVSSGDYEWAVLRLVSSNLWSLVFVGGAGGSGDALTTDTLAQFAATSSAQLRGVLTDESGTGFVLTTNGDGSALTGLTLSQIATFSSADLRGRLTDENGTGAILTVNGSGASLTGLTLNQLDDVLITSLADGDMLVYDAGSSAWINFATTVFGRALLELDDAADLATGLDSSITRDTEWDTLAEIETATSVNVIAGTEIDTSAEVRALVSDKVGSGGMMFTRTGVIREVWIDAGAMVPRTTNGPATATTESTTNDVMNDVLDFDAGTDEGAQFRISLPQAYANGTVKVKLYWTAASGTGDVIWAVQGGAISNDDAIDTAFGTAQTVTDTLIATGDVHVTSATASITIAGTPAADDLLYFQVYRDADAGGDTFSADARLLGIKLQYTESDTEPSAY